MFLFIFTCLTINIFMIYAAFKLHKNEVFNSVTIVPEVLNPSEDKQKNTITPLIREVVIDQGMPGMNLSDKIGDAADRNVTKTSEGIAML